MERQINVCQTNFKFHVYLNMCTRRITHSLTPWETLSEFDIHKNIQHTNTPNRDMYTNIHTDTPVHLSTLCIILYVFEIYNVLIKSLSTHLYRQISTCFAGVCKKVHPNRLLLSINIMSE